MGDHEIELSGKFGIPEIHGFAARLEGRYKGTWGARGKRLLADVTEHSGLSEDELAVRLEDSEELRDVLWKVGERSAGVSDEDYRSVLARLVAAALDDARILEATYLAAEVVKLEPVQVRVLLALFSYSTIPATEDGGKGPVGSPAEARAFSQRVVVPDQLAEQLDVSGQLIFAALGTLVGQGFASRIPEIREAQPGLRSRSGQPGIRGSSGTSKLTLRQERWRPTTWASEAVRLMFPNIAPDGDL